MARALPQTPAKPSTASAIATLTQAVALYQSQQIAPSLALLDSLPHGILDQAHCALVGLVYLGAGRDHKALAWYDRAVAHDPVPPGALARRALVLLRLGRAEEALAAYDKAIAAEGLDASGYYHRGNLLRGQGRRDEAIASYDEALRLNPAYPEALYAGGTILAESGQSEAAIAFFNEAVRLNPQFCQAWFGQGNALQALGRHEEALAAYDAALRISPEQPDLLINRGVALYDLGRNAEAMASYDKALDLCPALPQAWLNRSNLFIRLGEPQRALSDCAEALKLKPDYADALGSRGIALRNLGRLKEAIAAFDAAIEINPHFIHARNNRGVAHLLSGNFEEGLAGYEYRWIADETQKRQMNLPLREWAAPIRPGERILVFDEQALGDVIQFSRYLSALAQGGARVTFFCRKKLHRLLSTLQGDIVLTDRLEAPYDFDAQVGLSSLPYAFGTRLETIPAPAAYLAAEPERVAFWREKLKGEGRFVGLCWHGNQHFRGDPSRSIPLAAFAPLRQANARFFSLQVGAGEEQLDALPPSFKVESLGEGFDRGSDAFVDAAAVMSLLDLIITCDTSIAHLAGALGRPVWLLLKEVPDWRWLLERADSPWYPSMTLFRRAPGENWPALMERIGRQLQAL